jgi:two-component system, OmpR family, response regulator ChvI
MIVRILLVDDDVTLVGVLTAALQDEGFQVTSARNGAEALKRFEAEGADLLILDVLMPDMDGLEACRRLRRKSRVPIILLSSRGEEVDRVTGLETGADDYLSKPFSTRELVDRIRALGRRVAPDPDRDPSAESPAALAGGRIEAGALLLDPARFAVRWQGTPVVLTRSEFRLLLALARHRGLVLSRERLLEHARGDEGAVTDRTVDTLVKRLRKKIRQADPRFDGIETVFGLGYRYRE